jgi:EAL domain-containing protein (putative c-di-GMP-specific phosphodiesterase class I)
MSSVVGAGEVDLATSHGALRLLQKPVPLEEMGEIVAHALSSRRPPDVPRAREREAPSGAPQAAEPASDEFKASFTGAAQTLWIAYQLIVNWPQRVVFGQEALVRSNHPQLPSVKAILDAAERLGKLEALGRRIRQSVASDLPKLVGNALLFVNLHPRDLEDGSLMRGDSPLVAHAKRCVFELTERAALQSLADVRARIDRLRSFGFRFAIDDLGTGHASLAAVAHLRPEMVKIDMSLVRDIDRDPVRRGLFAALSQACSKLGIAVVAEGVETMAERDALFALGCDLMQGFLFARPGPAMPTPSW